METCDDLIQDEHYDVSGVTKATEALHKLHKQVQSKLNERQQLLESCGNFFARSMEVSVVCLYTVPHNFSCIEVRYMHVFIWLT